MRWWITGGVLLILLVSWGRSQEPPKRDHCEDKAPDLRSVAGAKDASHDTEESSNRPLDELDWMVGQWVDRGDDVTIETKVSWTANRAFLVRTFRVKTKDADAALEGTQVIGWDPVQRRIRSWTFDSAGGFGQGIWFRDGNRWVVKKSFVLAEGKRASAINVITYVDEKTLQWQSINREIAGEWQPNTPVVTVKRKQASE